MEDVPYNLFFILRGFVWIITIFGRRMKYFKENYRVIFFAIGFLYALWANVFRM